MFPAPGSVLVAFEPLSTFGEFNDLHSAASMEFERPQSIVLGLLHSREIRLPIGIPLKWIQRVTIGSKLIACKFRTWIQNSNLKVLANHSRRKLD